MMKIKVLINFGGVLTNERRILPGIYDADDEQLFNIADYLIDNRFAVIVADDVPMTDFTPERPQEDFEFHNKIMGIKGRPPYIPDGDDTESTDVETPATELEAAESDDELEAVTWKEDLDYSLLSRDRLLEEFEGRDIEVEGTGKDGRITKKDLVDALEGDGD